jgi:hypothetical protein
VRLRIAEPTLKAWIADKFLVMVRVFFVKSIFQKSTKVLIVQIALAIFIACHHVPPFL